jgi:hypothetical protein
VLDDAAGSQLFQMVEQLARVTGTAGIADS